MRLVARIVVIVVTMQMLAACSTSYKAVSGTEFPAFTDVPHIGGVVGIVISPASAQSRGNTASIENVAAAFSTRLRELGAFDAVVYPYTEFATVTPDYVVTLNVQSFFEGNMVENGVKAAAVGASMFLLAPIVPTTFEMKVDLSAEATDSKGASVGNYAFGDVYQLNYTSFVPNQDTMDEWVAESMRHTSEQVIQQLLGDSEKFAK